MSMASELIEVGDIDAAIEELMFAASHIARAVLLKQDVFPLSRPELPLQLENIEPSLSRLLQGLIEGELDIACLKAGKSLLEHQIEQIRSRSHAPESMPENNQFDRAQDRRAEEAGIGAVGKMLKPSV